MEHPLIDEDEFPMQVINYHLALGLGKFEPHFLVKLPLRLSRNAETPGSFSVRCCC